MEIKAKDNPEFQAFDWGFDVIDLRGKGEYREMRPIEIHHKADGTKDEKPSFVIVLDHPQVEFKVMGQISVAMLNYALEEIGYKIEKL